MPSHESAPARYAILIVDDEPTLREILAQILDGYQTTTVADGREAVRLLQNAHFELVITDLMMPNVDGFSVLTSAKQADPSTDVLVLTGYPSVENERKCRALGCTAVLAKPFAVTTIRAKVEECRKSHCVESTID
ncbi:MAG TPA: response regulator [bacterium]|nr:response regulator [bacterium]